MHAQAGLDTFNSFALAGGEKLEKSIPLNCPFIALMNYQKMFDKNIQLLIDDL